MKKKAEVYNSGGGNNSTATQSKPAAATSPRPLVQSHDSMSRYQDFDLYTTRNQPKKQPYVEKEEAIRAKKVGQRLSHYKKTLLFAFLKRALALLLLLPYLLLIRIPHWVIEHLIAPALLFLISKGKYLARDANQHKEKGILILKKIYQKANAVKRQATSSGNRFGKELLQFLLRCKNHKAVRAAISAFRRADNSLNSGVEKATDHSKSWISRRILAPLRYLYTRWKERKNRSLEALKKRIRYPFKPQWSKLVAAKLQAIEWTERAKARWEKLPRITVPRAKEFLLDKLSFRFPKFSLPKWEKIGELQLFLSRYLFVPATRSYKYAKELILSAMAGLSVPRVSFQLAWQLPLKAKIEEFAAQTKAYLQKRELFSFQPSMQDKRGYFFVEEISSVAVQAASSLAIAALVANQWIELALFEVTIGWLWIRCLVAEALETLPEYADEFAWLRVEE
jgi:hypothetical protein